MRAFFPRLLVSVGVLLLIMTLSFWMTRSAPGGPFDQAHRLNSAVEANLWLTYGMADDAIGLQGGRVAEVLASRGETLEEGRPILLLESGHTFEAPHDGRLIHVSFGVGDAVVEGATFAVIERPLWKQYLAVMKGYIVFDFGPSFQYPDRKVESLIGETFPVSMELGFWSLFIALFFGVGGGIFAGMNAGGWKDRLAMLMSALMVSCSTLILGPLLLLLFGVHLGWFEWGGWSTLGSRVLPAMTLGLVFAANIARMTRTGVVEAVEGHHVRTARAKGLAESRVILKHVLPGALIPLLGYLGPALAGLLCGSVVVERIFNIPGVSEYFVSGALNRDYPMVMGVVMLYSSLLIGFNLVLDVFHQWLDPRLKGQA